MYINITDEQSYEFSPTSGLELVTTVLNAEGEKVVAKRKNIANFTLRVTARVEVRSDGDTVPCARMIPQFSDSTYGEPITLPLKRLEKVDWVNDIDLRCLLNPDTPKVNEHIANLIRLQCCNVPEETTTVIDRLGTHIVEGVPLFHAGDRIIWPSGSDKNPNVIFKPVSNTRLVKDPDYTERESVAGMKRIIDLSREVGRFIFALVLLYVTRAAFVSAGITPRVFAFLYGKTGLKKTTYAAFQTQLYNRDEPLEPLTRLNASIPAAVQLLYEKDDCVTVLDDLFPAQDAEIHRRQEKTLLEITRVIGDGIESARMKGWKVAKKPPRAGVLATGEYYIGIGSDGARHLPLKMTALIDNDKLSACQREPLMLSSFYSFFIEWYVTNFNEIVGLLKEWKTAYRSTTTGIHDRLQETQFCLEAAYKLFLTYCKDKDYISHDDLVDQYNAFYQQLRSIVREQNTRVNKGMGGDPVAVDYVAVIRTLFLERRFRLVESIKDYEAKENDGVLYKGHLYLRQDRLMVKIRTFEPSAEFDDVLRCLKERGALHPGRNCNSRQLHDSKRGRCTRFYAIKLARLQ